VCDKDLLETIHLYEQTIGENIQLRVKVNVLEQLIEKYQNRMDPQDQTQEDISPTRKIVKA
jgi:hypothetical protein